MADKCIGKLTLDISDVEKKINDINTFLGKIGANINLEDKLSKKISTALNKLVDEAKKAGEETAKAMASGMAGDVSAEVFSRMEQKVLAHENKMQAEADKTLAKEAAATERAEERKRAAHERTEQKYYELVRKKEIADEQATKRTEQMYTQMFDRIAKKEAEQAARQEANRNKQTEQYTLMFIKSEEDAIKSIVAQYQLYYDWKTKAINAEAKGDTAGAGIFTQNAHAAYDEIQRLAQLYPDLIKTAEGYEQVRAAQSAWLSAITGTSTKEAAESIKAQEQAITDYANKLTAMLNEQAKFNNQVASGKLVEGSEQYTQAEEKLKHLEQTAIEAGQKLDQAGREAAMGMQQVQTAIDNVNVSMGAVNDSQQISALAQVETAYKNLTIAIRQYQIAQKANNHEGMSFWQSQIDASMQIVSSIEAGIDSLNVDEQTRQRILLLLEQMKTLQDGLTKGVIGSSGATGELESQVKSLVTRYLSLMAVIRTINSLIQNTVEYVSEYSDKMNEIQMITMKSDDEVAQLAETYREIASEMNASSLEMADAAIYFTRQGLPAEEIEKRLKNVTMYAKAANVEFKDASEIITAVVNSMGLVSQEAEDGRNAAQRVADVFLNIGDNAATSGQEIGEAMQKAAASAGAFGVSMEWLASYIAAVSETTRQEARTIGTAFNTIIARLHQIKQTGYNSDDETKVNDIAKALSKIDVVLMDQNNNWRDMEDILVEIADKWGDLDGKTKSYIATTMAGVKQQNVFLALMNDMSKGVENGSRAFELHEKALNSDGVAADKYAVYLDSVTAAQERLTIAQENFYSLLDQNAIKGWYDSLANIVNIITKATGAMGGLNIILPIVSGAVALLVVGLKNFAASVIAAGSASAYFATVWESHPVLLTITAVITAITLLTTTVGLFQSSVEDLSAVFDASNKKLEESQRKLDGYKQAQENTQKIVKEFGDTTNLTASELSEYNTLLNNLASISPVAKHVVDELKAGFIDQEEAVRLLNEELERLAENESRSSMTNLMNRYRAYQDDEIGTRDLAALINRYNTEEIQERGGGDRNKTFAAAVKSAYYTAEVNHDYIRGFSKKLYEEVKETLKSYIESGMTDDEAWVAISEDIAYKMFGSFEIPEDMAKSLEEKVNQEIDYVMSFVGTNLDPVDLGLVRKNLFDAIFGEDGELSSTEYGEFTNVILNWLRNFMTNGVDAVIDNADLLQNIGERFLGNYFDLLFGDQFENLKNSSDYDVIVASIKSAVSELITAGFSDVEIASVLEGLDLIDWSSAVGVMTNKLKEKIKETFNVKELGITDIDMNDAEYAETFDPLLWDQLDFSTLRLIVDLSELGVSYDQIQLAMVSSGNSVDVFREKLEALRKTVEGDSGSGEEPKTFTDIISDLQKTAKEFDKIDGYIKTLKNRDQIDIGDKLDIASTHPEFIQFFNDAEKLQKALEGLRAQMKQEAKNSLEDFMWNDEEFYKSTPFYDANFSNLLEYSGSLEEGSEALNEVAVYVDQSAEALVDSSEKMKEATDNWLQTQADAAEKASSLNYAKSTGFVYQIDELQRALSEEDGVQKAMEIWNSYDTDLQKSIASTYPNLIIALNNASKAMQNSADNADDLKAAQDGLNKELNKSQKYATAKYFQNTVKATKELREGTISATAAYDAFEKELDKVAKAQEEIVDVQATLAQDSDITKIDVSKFNNLAEVLGISAEQVKENFPDAIAKFEELKRVGQETLDALNREAVMRITGMSEADFSNLENGLLAIQEDAKATIDMLVATGQWEIQTEDLPQMAQYWDPALMKWIQTDANSRVTILKPKGNNPFATPKVNSSSSGSGSAKSSGGGGGGGGGGGSSSEKETRRPDQKLVDQMEEIKQYQDYRLEYYRAQQGYYSETGYLQGVIAYNEKEIDVLREQNETLQKNIPILRERMDIKRAELAGLSEEDESYAEVKEDLNKLTETYQKYNIQLVNNNKQIEAVTESTKKQREAIRDMQIDIREMVYKAIEDREKKIKEMFDAEVEMENTIFEVIKKRYEKEHDLIVDNTNKKIDALNKEKDLLGEQFELRKKMHEQDKSATELAKLEAQYQRIVADPTRLKEAQELQEKIAEARDKMAWDAAEQEVKSKQDSIDKRVDSLNDYLQSVEEYYDDLFEHPQKLIEEMREVMTRTDDEIIAWLKENDTTYAASSENTQKQMEDGWQATLDSMHGKITTYWAEVEEIVSQGDDAIIEFLKNNSDEYARAGELQAQKYVDAWKEKLDDLHKALEPIEAITMDKVGGDTNTSTTGGEASADSKGSGGGGGGGGGGTGKPKSLLDNVSGMITGYVGDYLGKFNNLAGKIGDAMEQTTPFTQRETLQKYKLTRYAGGGRNKEPGLAWLDGTMEDPETVLNPYQSELFDELVASMERISRINVPGLNGFQMPSIDGGRSVSVGDIIVNVDNLDTDDDYEELADKVSEVLIDRIGRTTTISGIRVGSY